MQSKLADLESEPALIPELCSRLLTIQPEALPVKPLMYFTLFRASNSRAIFEQICPEACVILQSQEEGGQENGHRRNGPESNLINISLLLLPVCQSFPSGGLFWP